MRWPFLLFEKIMVRVTYLVSFLFGQEKNLGGINEGFLININVKICLWRINIGTFCFKCSMSLCLISICVVKTTFPPQERSVLRSAARPRLAGRCPAALLPAHTPGSPALPSSPCCLGPLAGPGFTRPGATVSAYDVIPGGGVCLTQEPWMT